MSEHRPVQQISRDEFREMVEHARSNAHPEHWPADVHMMTVEGASYLGLDTKGQLYLDGQRLYTAQRLGDRERLLAGLVVFFTALAAIGTCIQAYAAFRSIPAPGQPAPRREHPTRVETAAPSPALALTPAAREQQPLDRAAPTH